MKNPGSAIRQPGQETVAPPTQPDRRKSCSEQAVRCAAPLCQEYTEADQAIFTSIELARGGGYQLAATSPGISPAEARELSAWGPSHDSLWETGESAHSCNFHRLQSGRLAISRSVHGAAEYSGRGGRSVYTHFLLFSTAHFELWEGNPFAILRAASHTESPLQPVPQSLPRWHCELPHCGDRIGQIPQLVETAGGPLNVAAALDITLRHEAVAFVGSPSAIEAAMEVLFLLLPETTRNQISFATGLKYSPRRPARWIGLHGDLHQRRRLARQYQFELVDLTEGTADVAALQALGSLLQEVAQGMPCERE